MGIITAGNPRPRLLPVTVDFAHGLARLPDGSLAVSDTGNNRLIRVDLETGRSTVIAGGLRAPLGIAAESSGALLVVEFDTGSVVRVGMGTAGERTTVARGLLRPYALARTDDGTLYVTEAGEVSRASGSLRRVSPSGAVTTIRLARQ